MRCLLRALTAGALLSACAGAALAADTPGRVGDPLGGRVDVIGSVERHRIVGEETLLEVARRNDLGYVELIAANPGVDPWLPGVGTEVVVPGMHVLPDAPRRGIVINITEMRLYLFSARGDVVGTWPIGIGREGGMTPLGSTRVVRKQLNPSWIPTPSIRLEKPELPASIPPGPDNPLGDRALYLGWPAYLIHGTNQPWGVGRRVSHGCIRLYPEDIVALYGQAPVGTLVTVVDQAVKLGWRDGMLYLQIHPSKTQADQIEAEGRFEQETLPELRDKVLAAAADRAEEIDWRAVDRAAVERRGVPIAVLGPGTSASEASGAPALPAFPPDPGQDRSAEDSTVVLPPIH
jgi:L,D-transpeptidase ErfK/SrfK